MMKAIVYEEFNQLQISDVLLIGRELEIVGSYGIQAHQYNEMLEMIKKASSNK